jgi:hypothetical protein
MTDRERAADRSRREFMKDIAAYGTAAITAAGLGDLVGAAQASNWNNRIGLELYTVRDRMAVDFEGVLAKVAAMGYKEIEPANGYNNMSPTQFRSMLDRLGLTMPSTPFGSERHRRNAGKAARRFPDHGDQAHGDLRRWVDFKPVFASAALAGLKHFAVEHDNAASWGDSLAAARVSYQNLARMLS